MRTDVVVIGAGQAGLSAAYGLRRGGLEPGREFVVLDGEDGPGGAWRHRWPTLRVDGAHRISDLPGLPFTPDDLTRPANEVVPAYFADHERTFDLRVIRPVHVSGVYDDDPDLRVETDAGTWTTRALINATGTWTRPFVPFYPGAATFRGRMLHAAGYRGPEEMAGRRVVVVGGGSTAVQLLLEIAPHAASTRWVTRREPEWFDGPFGSESSERGTSLGTEGSGRGTSLGTARGRAAVARVEERVRAGLPPRSVVSVTGLARTPAVVEGLRSGVLDRRPMFDRITPDGVAWGDGTTEDADVILWATGWRPAVGHLAPLNLRSEAGGIQLDGTRAARDPRVHLVGYGPSASTIGANRAGRAAAKAVLARLAAQDRTAAAA